MSRIDSSYTNTSPNTLLCFITFTVADSRLNDENSVDFFHRELARLENVYGIRWVSWVIMPDHFHGLFETEQKHISSTLTQLRFGISQRLNLQIRIKKCFWQSLVNDPQLCQNTSFQMNTYMHYISEAPVRAGLVTKSEYWPTQYSVLMNTSGIATERTYGLEGRTAS